MGKTASGAEAESWYEKHPDYRVDVALSPHKVSVVFNGKTIAESDRVLVLQESDHDPVFYFPRSAVKMGYLDRTDHRTYCPFKGEASYWHLRVDGRQEDNAVWSYHDPLLEVSGIQDFVAFYWDRVDAWYADGERLETAAA